MQTSFNTDHFKQKLEAELQRLEGELATVGHQDPNNPIDWQVGHGENDVLESDKNEVADKFEEMVDNNAIMNELEVQYNEVNAALDRISQGTFGICEKGGEPIAEKRLETFPAARNCIEHNP
jgi:RNA polymerase-binding transcription factor DksA